MSHADQLDGTFRTVLAHELRRWDVICQPARCVLSVNRASSDCIGVHTGIGRELLDPVAPVKIFRPRFADETAAQECLDCGAAPGESCEPTICLALSQIDDAAESIFGASGDEAR